MGDKSKIEWTDATWNPVTGCTKVSQGCKHCYAERTWLRLCAPGQPYAGRAFTDVQCHPERLEQPLRWKKPRMVFVNSMSDLFHEHVPEVFIISVFMAMARAPQHKYQVLTKRPERMRSIISGWVKDGLTLREGCGAVLPSVWLGVSAEDQETWDERSEHLFKTPAVVRWASLEPLLGPVDLEFDEIDIALEKDGAGNAAILGGLDWVVVGGESGPKARPLHPDWVRSIRDQCRAYQVPFFFKQWGEWAPNCLCGGAYPCRTTPRPKPGKMGVIFRCGKSRAGRDLDGQTLQEYP